MEPFKKPNQTGQLKKKKPKNNNPQNSHKHDQLLVYLHTSDHITELRKGDPAITVLIMDQDGFVHKLLQLPVLEVVTHHHLQHLEELPVGDVAIFVHVIDLEGEPYLLLFVALDAELRGAHDELVEVHFPVAIRVEDVDHSTHQRVLLQLRQRHKLFCAQGPRFVQVHLPEAFPQPSNLIVVEVVAHLGMVAGLVSHGGGQRAGKARRREKTARQRVLPLASAARERACAGSRGGQQGGKVKLGEDSKEVCVGEIEAGGAGRTNWDYPGER